MALWNWYNHLMGNNLFLIACVIVSVFLINWWGKKEEEWKRNNSFSSRKKVLKIIGIILIVIFGLPGIILLFGSV